MKPNCFKITCLFICIFQIGYAQKWTDEQLKKANTAELATYMTQTERDVIKYMNLARLYPLDYLKIEVLGSASNISYSDSDSFYVNSLIRHLKSMSPTHALKPDKNLFESAKCFAKESGEKGIVGHDRVNCTKSYWAECCFYGSSDPGEIVLGWLIDEDVPSLGHRLICLGDYNTVGISLQPHKSWGNCTVSDFGR